MPATRSGWPAQRYAPPSRVKMSPASIYGRPIFTSDLWSKQPVEDLNLVDLSPTPDQVFEAEQRLLRMKAILERLGDRTQEIFFMNRLQGYNHAEIAGRLNVCKSTVEKHLARALTVVTMEDLKR